MATTYTTDELRRLFYEKACRDIPLTDDEKAKFIAAYWDGKLPKSRSYSLEQWVEDGCKSFMDHGGSP